MKYEWLLYRWRESRHPAMRLQIFALQAFYLMKVDSFHERILRVIRKDVAR